MNSPLRVVCWVDGTKMGAHLMVAEVHGRLCLSIRGERLLEVNVSLGDVDHFINAFSYLVDPIACVCLVDGKAVSLHCLLGVGESDDRGVMTLEMKLFDSHASTHVVVDLNQEQTLEVRQRAVQAAPPRPRELSPLIRSVFREMDRRFVSNRRA